MDKDYYVKAIRKALRDNRTYGKEYDLLISKAAQYCALVDRCFEEVEERGLLIDIITREGNVSTKQNPAAALLEKYGKIIASYFDALGLSPKSSLGVSDEDPVNKLMKKVNSIS